VAKPSFAAWAKPIAVGLIVFLALTIGLRLFPAGAVVLAIFATGSTYLWRRFRHTHT
jgi:hypothetical protein